MGDRPAGAIFIVSFADISKYKQQKCVRGWRTADCDRCDSLIASVKYILKREIRFRWGKTEELS